MGYNLLLPFLGQIGHPLQGLGIPDHRPAWHRNDEGRTVPTVPIFALAVFGMRNQVVLLISKVQKRSKLTGRSKDNIPAVSAVAAVGTPSRHVFLPSEADATVAAIPGLNEYFNLIDKHKFNDGSDLMGSGGPKP
jgi:hypothetical protein